MWTVEQTGGGCTADVARVTCDRTGQDVALVVTDGNACAFTLGTIDPREGVVRVHVLPAASWWGEGPRTGDLEEIEEAPVQDADLCAMFTGALGDAGVTVDDTDAHGHSERVHALAMALLDARRVTA